MGKTLKEQIDALEQERGRLYGEMTEIIGKEKRSADDTAKFDQNEARMAEIDRDIKRMKTVLAEEQRQAAMAGAAPVVFETQKSTSMGVSEKDVARAGEFSFLKVMREASYGKGVEGYEAEMLKEGEIEAKSVSRGMEGMQIPDIVLRAPSRFNPRISARRDMTATGTTTVTLDQGGMTIPTLKVGFIDALWARLVLVALGAKPMGGLSGDVDLPGWNAKATGTWEGENDDNAESSPTTRQVQLRPFRLGTFTDVSKRLLMQSSVDVEMRVRDMLLKANATAIETAGINGAGTTEPFGILNTVGIGSVAGGTNGLEPEYSHILKLEEEVAIDDADFGSLNYLTNPKVRRVLKGKVAASGGGVSFIWTPGQNEVNGYKAGVSTLVPSNLDKGTSTGVCSAIIFGNFNDLVIAQWAGIDMVVNPFTKAKNALVEVIINSYNDIGVLRPQSFAAMKDALTA